MFSMHPDLAPTSKHLQFLVTGRSHLSLVAGLIMLSASASSAQDTALIIGNSDYNAGANCGPGTSWADLPGVVPDVMLKQSKLQNAGWTVVVSENRTAAQMAADITANIPMTGKKYIVWYAGHGRTPPCPGANTGQWIGVDGSELTAAQFVAALGAAANRTLTILDSCGGGEFADTVNATTPAIGFITSTTDLECAGKGPGGGFFSQCFGGALNSAADQPPYGNADGQTTVAEAAAYMLANCDDPPNQTPTWDGDHAAWVIGRPKAAAPIPTVSEWGLIVLTLLLLIAATIIFARRRTAVSAA